MSSSGGDAKLFARVRPCFSPLPIYIISACQLCTTVPFALETMRLSAPHLQWQTGREVA